MKTRSKFVVSIIGLMLSMSAFAAGAPNYVVVTPTGGGFAMVGVPVTIAFDFGGDSVVASLLDSNGAPVVLDGNGGHMSFQFSNTSPFPGGFSTGSISWTPSVPGMYKVRLSPPSGGVSTDGGYFTVLPVPAPVVITTNNNVYVTTNVVVTVVSNVVVYTPTNIFVSVPTPVYVYVPTNIYISTPPITIGTSDVVYVTRIISTNNYIVIPSTAAVATTTIAPLNSSARINKLMTFEVNCSSAPTSLMIDWGTGTFVPPTSTDQLGAASHVSHTFAMPGLQQLRFQAVVNGQTITVGYTVNVMDGVLLLIRRFPLVDRRGVVYPAIEFTDEDGQQIDVSSLGLTASLPNHNNSWKGATLILRSVKWWSEPEYWSTYWDFGPNARYYR